MALGLYISVPFCRTKCSYCNFASDVFSRAVFERYLDRVAKDIEHAAQAAEKMQARFDPVVDSIYIGGGTPTILDITQLERLFVTVSQNFDVLPGAEITAECAPGTLAPQTVEALLRGGVNRVSLGVQSFIDEEARSVGRLHTNKIVHDEIARLREAGLNNINLDLIAGLPHQTLETWKVSLAETIASDVPHASVYMLEVDQDSRLGRELIAGGARYHAHHVPDEELTADLYTLACQRLEAAGICQYEISNFAREGHESRHNLKYWTRQPYLGFGVDAHSMLLALDRPAVAVRFSTPDSLEQYATYTSLDQTIVSPQAALEEAFFLGLRLTCGVNLEDLAREFGEEAVRGFSAAIAEFTGLDLLEHAGSVIRLTPQGRLLSNEVFGEFVTVRDQVT